MNARFRITVGSEPEYEDLVGNLYYDDRIVCVITQEKRPEAMEIEYFAPPSGWKFSDEELSTAVERLKQRMFELRRDR